MSEWAYSPEKIVEAAARLLPHVPQPVLASELAPYNIFPAAQDVLPASPLVYHYHPPALLYEWARRNRMLVGHLQLTGKRVSSQTSELSVEVLQGDKKSKVSATVGKPVALLLSPGPAKLTVFARTRHASRVPRRPVLSANGARFPGTDPPRHERRAGAVRGLRA